MGVIETVSERAVDQVLTAILEYPKVFGSLMDPNIQKYEEQLAHDNPARSFELNTWKRQVADPFKYAPTSLLRGYAPLAHPLTGPQGMEFLTLKLRGQAWRDIYSRVHDKNYHFILDTWLPGEGNQLGEIFLKIDKASTASAKTLESYCVALVQAKTKIGKTFPHLLGQIQHHYDFTALSSEMQQLVRADQAAVEAGNLFREEMRALHGAAEVASSRASSVRLKTLLHCLAPLSLLVSVGFFVEKLSRAKDADSFASVSRGFMNEMMIASLPISAWALIEGTKVLIG